MRSVLLFFLLAIVVNSSFGQIKESALIDNLAFNRAIEKNLRFPAVAQRLGRSVRTYVSFTIDSQGSYQDVAVINLGPIDESLKQEVDRLWHILPQQGPKYAGSYVIPIAFMLSEGGPKRLKPLYNQEDNFNKPGSYVLLKEISVVGYVMCELRPLSF